MSGAIYMSAAGAMAYEKRMQVISNNLANINTSGFKNETGHFQTIDSPESKLISGSDQPVASTLAIGNKIHGIAG